MDKKEIISVIIPVYNEQNTIEECLMSLKKQSYEPVEIIIVDDGSTDKTIKIVQNSQLSTLNFQLIRQDHLGPGTARNLGAKKAKGKILVFVDADMTFSPGFIKDLTLPILLGKTIGTFSKNEMNANFQNPWSHCWNINRNWPKERLIPIDYPEFAPVFRAILKKEFTRVGGFDTNGDYTDDWSLSKKLGVKSTSVKGALYFHKNPSSLAEVWGQARWIGKNKFISGTFPRKLKSFLQYSLPFSLVVATFKAALNKKPQFVIFKIWYDLAIWVSVMGSFLGEKKFK